MAGGGAFRGMKAHLSANNSISNNSATTPTVWTEVYDVGGFHDGSTNTDRFTFGGTGYFLISIQQEWAADAAGYREMQVERVDTSASTHDGIILKDRMDGSSNTTVSGASTTVYIDDATDYLKVNLYQNSGAALNAIGGSGDVDSTTITITRLDMASSISNSAGGSGYVQISDGSGGFTYDNNNFFWDVTNNRLGVGTASPSYSIDTTASGTVRAATFTGALSGNATTATTVTQAAQSSITSLGTLTTLTVDNITVNGNTISTGANDLTINTAGGSVYIQDHLKPQADDTYDLGSTGYAWRNLHLEGDITMQDAGKIATSAGDLTIEVAGNNVVVKGTGSAASFLDVDSVSGQNSRLRFLNGTTAKWNVGNDAGASDNFTLYNQAASANSISITAANVLTLGGNTSVSGTLTSTGQIKYSGSTGSGVWIDRTGSANAYLRLSNTTDTNGYLGYEGTSMVFNTANNTRMTLSATGLGIGIGSMNSILHVQKDASTTWSVNGYSNPYNYQPHPHELAIINTQDNTTNSFAGIYFGAGETSSGSQINSARIAAIRTAAFTTDLAFATRGAAGAFAEKMRINSAGAVGIGTANPIPMTPHYGKCDNGYSSVSSIGIRTS